MCMNNSSPLKDEALQIFGMNADPVDADLYKGGIFLGCSFGIAAMYIWAVGILAAGQSSTMTGTYAGQFCMEGFLNLQWARWKRVIVTRLIAIVPTFCVAYFSNIQDLTGMNDILNAVMSLQLPFAVIPTIAFTSSVAIMGDFVNGIGNKVVSIVLFILVIGINITFVVDRLNDAQLDWAWFTLVSEYNHFHTLKCRSVINHIRVCSHSHFQHFLHFVQHLLGYSHGCLHGKSTIERFIGKSFEC